MIRLLETLARLITIVLCIFLFSTLGIVDLSRSSEDLIFYGFLGYMFLVILLFLGLVLYCVISSEILTEGICQNRRIFVTNPFRINNRFGMIKLSIDNKSKWYAIDHDLLADIIEGETKEFYVKGLKVTPRRGSTNSIY